MIKPLASMNVTQVDVPSSLESRYPELAEHLSDMQGFYLYVKRQLTQFGLERRYSPDEVINECLIRWHKAVQSGKQVPVIAGWMRVTAGYIVKELDREVKKSNPYDPDILAEMVSLEAVEREGDHNEEHQLINKALKTLSRENRELLELRWFQGMSWEAIAVLKASEGKKVKVGTLRKRGQRALEELRKVYLGMCS